MPTTFLIINPASGSFSRRRIAQVVHSLTRAGLPPIIHPVRNPAEAYPCCQAIRRVREHPFIIVAAGDGTFNAVLNGLGPGPATLAVLPLGTSNVLAAELGIASLADGIARICAGKTGPLATGLLEFDAGRRYFALMAGSGLDGAVVGGVRAGEKRVLKQGAYALSAFRAALGWDRGMQEIVADGKCCLCHTAVVCNASRYGGNFRLSPGSSLFRSGFEIACVTKADRRGYLAIARNLFLGRPMPDTAITWLTATEIELRGTKPIQLDGDFVGHGPARITAVADFARLIM
ncbi:diacylglycerol kinase family lipid kinase [Geobacter sp. FeAm09]|uniref:diacylglycerol/lipid kinase family protein n=1 Tax=Geobacter sp. FeAm09 TaxID=2597769 RepID=UPI0011EE3F2B|nr:diacylglycerol kinase family protein [Geobacter sp. FeAm09]QEM67130.1 diacylglycerol kinase family lipid kinase [Geobacter sp. FeAm09]